MKAGTPRPKVEAAAPLYRRLAIGGGSAALVVVDVATLGFITLGFEMVASRILTPLFGSGIYTWATIISIVVAGLMAGYFIGGFAVFLVVSGLVSIAAQIGGALDGRR